MDFQALADLLFPNVTDTPEMLEERFPQRNAPEGAVITRMAPSPTGFVHLGNLVQGLTAERMAHQSGGVLFLRVEDTDAKREVPGAVEVLTQKYRIEDIHDGDVFIANDPYTGGGSHLPDIVLLKPVFYQGKLVAYMVNTGHHADKSRKGPTIYDEGLRIPLVKMYSKGELVQDVFDLIMLNFQMKYERQGDLNAQIITKQFGADKLSELLDKIGLDTYEEFCKKWLEYGEKKARIAIKELPDGEYCFEDYMADDGAGGGKVLIKTKVIIKGD